MLHVQMYMYIIYIGGTLALLIFLQATCIVQL